MEVIEKTPEQIASMEASMKASGAPTHESVQADYFGFEETGRIFLPDGVSYVDHRILNEGARRKYLNAVNRDVRIQRATGDALMRMSPGDEKKSLLESAIIGWNLTRDGQPVPFSRTALTDFLDKAPPKIVDLIEKEVRKANAWLQADMSVEDLQKEIDSLEELKQQKIKEEEGNAS